MTFDALSLDVGGVFLVPSHDRVEAVLRDAGVVVDRSRFWDGHYAAMHAVDAAQSPPETFDDYAPAFCHHIGLRDTDWADATEALRGLLGPSGVWTEPIIDSICALHGLAETGIPMAVVSNADGTVATILREAGVCQEGPGPLVEMRAIVDSGAIGVAKPDPEVFAPAVEALAVAPDRILHIGDSVHYDVVGARAAGLAAAHFDPRGLCRSEDHRHIRSLSDLL